MTSRRQLLAAAAALPLAPHAALAAQRQRQLVLDLAQATQPLDRFFDHCVGSDSPGTLCREDSLA